MSSRRLLNRLYYFTVEDEGILNEAFPKFETKAFCIAYKLVDTDDVFVTTAETKEMMDRHDLPYNLLAEEEAGKIALLHSVQSKEELADYDDSIKALVLAHRGIGAICVGVNGEPGISELVAESPGDFSYFTAPAGHTFLWRLVPDRRTAKALVKKLLPGDKKAVEWAESLPLASARELKTYH
ncbi:MAG TPA: hypothetical protein VI942_13820 [Thermoanaerobaculia bacterium]|nr:hypothetical protein [Thermoanaerobaculia bacterium]